MKMWMALMVFVMTAPLGVWAQEDQDTPTSSEAIEEAVETEVAQAPKAEWNADAGINGILNTGNSENETVGGNGLVSWKLERNKLEWKGEFNYGRSKDPATGIKSTNTKNWKTSLRYDRFVSDPLSLFGLGHIGADAPAGFDLRYGGATGLSHELWKTDPNFFKYEVGYDLTREDRVAPPDETIHSARAYALYKHDFSKYASFSQDIEALFNVTEGDDVRLNSETALTMKLTDILAFKASFKVKFDNEPVAGKKKTDTTTQVGLVFDLI